MLAAVLVLSATYCAGPVLTFLLHPLPYQTLKHTLPIATCVQIREQRCWYYWTENIFKGTVQKQREDSPYTHSLLQHKLSAICINKSKLGLQYLLDMTLRAAAAWAEILLPSANTIHLEHTKDPLVEEDTLHFSVCQKSIISFPAPVIIKWFLH